MWEASKKTEYLDYFLGFGAGLLGALTATFSKLYIKRSHNLVKKTGESSQASRLSFGIAVFLLVINPGFDAISFGLAPQSVAATTAGPAVLFNLLLAPKMLKEKWTRWDVIGSVLVCIATAGIGVSGNKDPPKFDYDELLALYSTSRFLHMMLAWSGVMSIFLAFILVPSAPYTLKMVSWGCASGSVAGLYFFVKTLTTMFSFGGVVFGRWETWLVALGVGFSCVGGILIMNLALKRFPAMYVSPLYQALLVIVGAISGDVFFDELDGMTYFNKCLYFASVAVMVLGMACSFVSQRRLAWMAAGGETAKAKRLPGNKRGGLNRALVSPVAASSAGEGFRFNHLPQPGDYGSLLGSAAPEGHGLLQGQGQKQSSQEWVAAGTEQDYEPISPRRRSPRSPRSVKYEF